jgi:hypothetical protein
MSVEHRWNDTDRGEQNNSERNLSQRHFVRHKSHMDSTGRNPGLRPERRATNDLSHDTACAQLEFRHRHRLDSPTRAVAFLRTFCQLYIFFTFRDKSLSQGGFVSPKPNAGYPGGPMFSVRVVSLSRLVPILKRDLTFLPLHDLAV